MNQQLTKEICSFRFAMNRSPAGCNWNYFNCEIYRKKEARKKIDVRKSNFPYFKKIINKLWLFSVAVKVLLYERGVQLAVRRTKSFRRDEIATFPLREKFVFSLPLNGLHEASCQIILFTKPKIGTFTNRVFFLFFSKNMNLLFRFLGTKRTLGRIYLGHRHFFSASANSKAITAGIDHWHDMIHRSDIAIERWHPLNWFYVRFLFSSLLLY